MGKFIDESGNVYGKLSVLQINKEKGRASGLYYECKCTCGEIKTVRGALLRNGRVTSCGCDKPTACSEETGRIYGNWLVIGLTEKKSRRGSTYLNCRCACGTEKTVLVASLRNGYSKSCGCNRDHQSSKNFRDLTGNRFGKLQVVHRNLDKNDGKTRWNCLCDCGIRTIARSDKLLGGFSQSCGCDITPNEIGKVYGKLTVEGPPQLENGEMYWPCRCNCGAVALKRGVDLRNGHIRACSKGCLASDRFFETGINELIGRTRQSALKRGLAYSLSRTDHARTIGMPCAYCNCPPSNELRTFRRWTLKFKYSGIDRIDSSKGYIHGNINPCCKDCNVAKGDKSLIDYFEWVKRAYLQMSLKYGSFMLDRNLESMG
jgi:hypothetical protein